MLKRDENKRFFFQELPLGLISRLCREAIKSQGLASAHRSPLNRRTRRKQAKDFLQSLKHPKKENLHD